MANVEGHSSPLPGAPAGFRIQDSNPPSSFDSMRVAGLSAPPCYPSFGFRQLLRTASSIRTCRHPAVDEDSRQVGVLCLAMIHSRGASRGSLASDPFLIRGGREFPQPVTSISDSHHGTLNDHGSRSLAFCGAISLDNVEVHTPAAGGVASTQVEGGSDGEKSDSERAAGCGATPCSAFFITSARCILSLPHSEPL